MKVRSGAIANWWEELRGSLWLVPMAFVLAGFAVAIALPVAERALAERDEGILPFLTISPSAARTLLGTIAGSLITVVALVFSVTFLALQQAASRYTPRIIGDFLNDRTNRAVLGLYLGTFAHALLVMTQVREDARSTDVFVPALSVALNVSFALASLGAFIWFMHHIATSLQVGHILGSIAGELWHSIARSTTKVDGGAGSQDPPPYEMTEALSSSGVSGQPFAIVADRAGYLRRIERHDLIRLAGADAELVHVLPRVGQFVQLGSVLVNVWLRDEAQIPSGSAIRGAFILGSERSMVQDPLFGINQLVDIGLRALSPAINDPMTAIQCIDQISVGLVHLGSRQLRPSSEGAEGGAMFFFNEPNFDDFVDAGVGPLRRAATNLDVVIHLLLSIQGILKQLDSGPRKLAFRSHVKSLLGSLERLDFPKADKRRVERLAEEVLQAIPGLPLKAGKVRW